MPLPIETRAGVVRLPQGRVKAAPILRQLRALAFAAAIAPITTGLRHPPPGAPLAARDGSPVGFLPSPPRRRIPR